MNIIKDKDAIAYTDNYDVVLVGTSIYNMLGNGFQSKIRYKYPYVDEINDTTPYGDTRKLGKRLTIDGEPIISLLYICGYNRKSLVTLDYDALENALLTAKAEFKGKRVMTTVLGASQFDGNGDRERVLDIMVRSTKGLDLDVYDYRQLPKMEEIWYWKRKIFLIKDINRKKYIELTKGRNEILRKLYLIK
jgi:hypothetical protein